MSPINLSYCIAMIVGFTLIGPSCSRPVASEPPKVSEGSENSTSLDAWVPATGVTPRSEGTMFRHTKHPFYRFSGRFGDSVASKLIICPYGEVLADGELMEAFLNEVLIICQESGGADWSVKATRFLSDQPWAPYAMHNFDHPDNPTLKAWVGQKGRIAMFAQLPADEKDRFKDIIVAGVLMDTEP